MKELYEQMKKALDYFDLRFHDMDKVKVELGNRCIIFTYENKMIKVME